MEDLIQIFNAIEARFKQKNGYLKKIRKAFIVAILLCSVHLVFRAFRMSERYNIPMYQMYFAIAGIIATLLAPVVFAPLFTFFDSRLHNQFNWDIKMGIFNNVFHQYGIDFRVSFNNQLSEKDVKDIQLDDSVFSFVYGDDLIFGETNDFNFRIAEMHSTKVVKRDFDGLIGVMIFNSEEESLLKFNKDFKRDITDIEIIQKNNKIFFMKNGKKKYFEFSFKGGQLNKDSLLEDYNDLKTLVEVMFSKHRQTA